MGRVILGDTPHQSGLRLIVRKNSSHPYYTSTLQQSFQVLHGSLHIQKNEAQFGLRPRQYG
jgi:hypothetical protein